MRSPGCVAGESFAATYTKCPSAELEQAVSCKQHFPARNTTSASANENACLKQASTLPVGMGVDCSLAWEGRQPELSTTTLLSCEASASAAPGTTSTSTREPGRGRPAGAIGSRDCVAVSAAAAGAEPATPPWEQSCLS